MPHYPRKRISVACQYCRHRKRRCDGIKPRCSLCRDSEIDCEYPKIVDQYALQLRVSLSYREADSFWFLQGPLEKLNRREMANGPFFIVWISSEQSSYTEDNDEACEESKSRNDVRFPYEALAEDLPSLPEAIPFDEEFNLKENGHEREDSQARASGITQINTTLELHSPLELLGDTQLQHIASGLSYDSTSWQTSHPNLQVAHLDFPRPGHVSRYNTHDPNSGNELFSIPNRHLSSTGSLFDLEPIRHLIGEYPHDFFYHVESQRVPSLNNNLNSPVSDLDGLDLTPEGTEPLLAAFFADVHIHFPVLNCDTFRPFFQDTLRSGRHQRIDLALCLMVLALGKLALNMRESGIIVESQSENGMEYFLAGHHLLTANFWSYFQLGTSMPMGLILGSIYLSYNNYSLAAWQLTFMASTKVQIIISQYNSPKAFIRDTRSQAFPEMPKRLLEDCAGHIIRCVSVANKISFSDILAELHLPRSGIDSVVHQIRLPRCDQQDGLLFLALCSMRSLLNRIHHTLYAAPETFIESDEESNTEDSIASSPMFSRLVLTPGLEGLINELTRQLECWYTSLPDQIRPDLDSNTANGPVHRWLLSRYWSAQNIITRPCLLYAASVSDASSIPPFVVMNSQICVESCRKFVNNATEALKYPSQYTWMMAQACVLTSKLNLICKANFLRCLSCALVLTIAARSTVLKPSVPDLDDLLTKMISMNRRWAKPNSSSESIDCILSIIQKRQRLDIL
ncbi:uncharacterized protein N7496_002273 [Penicillium cataractarum]|uniref:Zn(2)-C6 fungal-type domain-containing protein n=1 Tax=Penicillium cataractarum TaxID=2100454 RepID=A0A9W9SKY8_9EURO|nr:uncharacterized protein N7496_002273 [Penicillium cataractarum]KAJ5379845.1 hypothetical protein N7496_002273 [Penicillium cataractarum]